MVSKYDGDVWEILEFHQILSTNDILKKLEKKTGKKINWFHVHRILKALSDEGKAERFENKSGIFWRKK